MGNYVLHCHRQKMTFQSEKDTRAHSSPSDQIELESSVEADGETLIMSTLKLCLRFGSLEPRNRTHFMKTIVRNVVVAPNLHPDQTFSVFVHVKIDHTFGNERGGIAKPLRGQCSCTQF